MKKNLIYKLTVLLLITFSVNLFSQETTVNSKKKLYIDFLENNYIVNKDNLSLITKSKTIEYQNSFLGDIFSIDISNPLRILIFHKDANQLVFIDNELSPIGNPINLDALGLADTRVVCSSQINGFWLFNNLNNRIEFYNSKLIKAHSSIDLSQYINSVTDIQEISMSRGKVYLRVKETGILIFDMFASYIKTIPLKELNSFQVLDHSILFSKGHQVLVYNFETLSSSVLFQSNSDILYAKLYNASLFYTNNNNSIEKVNITSVQK